MFPHAIVQVYATTLIFWIKLPLALLPDLDLLTGRDFYRREKQVLLQPQHRYRPLNTSD